MSKYKIFGKLQQVFKLRSDVTLSFFSFRKFEEIAFFLIGCLFYNFLLKNCSSFLESIFSKSWIQPFLLWLLTEILAKMSNSINGPHDKDLKIHLLGAISFEFFEHLLIEPTEKDSFLFWRWVVILVTSF